MSVFEQDEDAIFVPRSFFMLFGVAGAVMLQYAINCHKKAPDLEWIAQSKEQWRKGVGMSKEEYHEGRIALLASTSPAGEPIFREEVMGDPGVLHFQVDFAALEEFLVAAGAMKQ